MINRNRVNRFVMVVIFSIFVTVGSSSVFATNNCMDSARVKKVIHIQVDENQQAYFHDHACSPTPTRANGDICVEKNGKPLLVFRLEGRNAKGWELVRFELGQNDSSWPGDLPDGAFSDFEFDTDAGLRAGHPYVKLNSKKNKMEVKNNNCHKFIVHYRVVLKNMDGQEQTLHPILDNKGTGF